MFAIYKVVTIICPQCMLPEYDEALVGVVSTKDEAEAYCNKYSSSSRYIDGHLLYKEVKTLHMDTPPSEEDSYFDPD